MLTATTQVPNTVNAASLAFVDDVIASWQTTPAADPNEVAALLAEISELVPNLVVNFKPGSEYLDESELRGFGQCDRTLNNPVRHNHSAYLEGYLKRSQLMAAE